MGGCVCVWVGGWGGPESMPPLPNSSSFWRKQSSNSKTSPFFGTPRRALLQRPLAPFAFRMPHPLRNNHHPLATIRSKPLANNKLDTVLVLALDQLAAIHRTDKLRHRNVETARTTPLTLLNNVAATVVVWPP